MADLPSAFANLSDDTHGVIESLLSDVYRGGDWGDEHEDMLIAWRGARGEAAMDGWHWWVGEVDGESYDEEGPTREEAIEKGRARYVDEGRFQIIEARLWTDTVKEGEDVSPFADTRNHEIIPVVANG